jgi:hypothetical protein
VARRTQQEREAGQSPVMAVLVLAAIAVVAGIFVTGRLAVATDDRGEASHGADAAALAGAQAVLDQIPSDVAPGFLLPSDVPLLLGGGHCLRTGYPQATRLAQANNVRLTSYCYDAFTDEIEVTVAGDDGAEAEATAATSFDAGSCTLDPGFRPPTPEPSPEPSDPGDDGGDDDGGDDGAPPPPPPPPPSPVRTLLDCGIANLVVTYNPVDSRFHFVGLELALADVKPRLTR